MSIYLNWRKITYAFMFQDINMKNGLSFANFEEEKNLLFILYILYRYELNELW